MATWTIERREGRLRVRWQRLRGDRPVDCGTTPDVLPLEVALAWTAAEAGPLDLIVAEGRQLVVLPARSD